MIYRDALGSIIEHSHINGYDQNSQPSIWFFGNQINGAYGKFSNYAAARDHARALGFTAPETSGEPGYISISIRCPHPAAIAQAQAEREAAIAKWTGAEKIYVRFGRLPPSGHSRNHRDGYAERGVSVFRGERAVSGEIRILFSRPDEMGSYYLGLNARKMRVVTGREIGTGSDGEPLLVGARYAN